jgi:hypothetical protein
MSLPPIQRSQPLLDATFRGRTAMLAAEIWDMLLPADLPTPGSGQTHYTIADET